MSNVGETVTSVGNGWIICQSKSYSGRIYYFNTSNGEATWNLSEMEVQKAKQRTKSIQSQPSFSIENYPEPLESPVSHSELQTQPTYKYSDRDRPKHSRGIPKVYNKQIINNQFTKPPDMYSSALMQCSSMNPTSFNIPGPPALNPGIWTVAPQPMFVTPTISQAQLYNSCNVDFVPVMNTSVSLTNRFKKITELDQKYPSLTQDSVQDIKCQQKKKIDDGFNKNVKNDLCLSLSLGRVENLCKKNESKASNYKGSIPLYNQDNEAKQIDNSFPHSTSSFDKNEDDESFEENLESYDHIKQIEIKPLRSFLHMSKNSVLYIVTDSNVLLNNVNFLNYLLQPGNQCCLVVPRAVMNKIQDATNSRLRTDAHRAAYFVLQQVDANHAVIDDTTKMNEEDGEDIINCCTSLINLGKYVVLLTDEIQLHNNEYTSNIRTLTVKEMKRFVSASKSSKISNEKADVAQNRNIKDAFKNNIRKEDEENEQVVSTSTEKCFDSKTVAEEKRKEQDLNNKTYDVGIQTESCHKTVQTVPINRNNNINVVISTKIVDNIGVSCKTSGIQLKRHLYHDKFKINNADRKKLVWRRHKKKSGPTLVDDNDKTSSASDKDDAKASPTLFDYDTKTSPKLADGNAKASLMLADDNAKASNDAVFERTTADLIKNYDYNAKSSHTLTDDNVKASPTLADDNAETSPTLANDNAKSSLKLADDNPKASPTFADDNAETSPTLADDNAKSSLTLADENAKASPTLADDNTQTSPTLADDNAKSSLTLADDNAKASPTLADDNAQTSLMLADDNAKSSLTLPDINAKVCNDVVSECTTPDLIINDIAFPGSGNLVLGLSSHMSIESLYKPGPHNYDGSSETSSFVIKTMKPHENVTIEETSLLTSGMSSTLSTAGSESILKGVELNKQIIENYDNNVMFEVTDSRMEEYLRMKSDEWVSRFVQIMEEALTQVLHQDPPFVLDSMPPPWTIHEATECVKKKFHTDPDVVDAATKLLIISFENGGSRGKIKSNITPSKYMVLYSYGVYLIDALQGLLSSNEDLQTASESLSKLLSDIQDPHLDPSNQDSFIDSVIHENEVNTDGNDTSNGVNDSKSNCKEMDKITSSDGKSKTTSSPFKYNLRSARKKLLEEKNESGNEYVENIDRECSFFSSLDLKKNALKKNTIRSSKIGSAESAKSEDKLKSKDDEGVSLNLRTNNDVSNELVVTSAENNETEVISEPKIIRKFSKCSEYEERFKNKNSQYGYNSNEDTDIGYDFYGDEYWENSYYVTDIPNDACMENNKPVKDLDKTENYIHFTQIIEKLESIITESYSTIQEFCVNCCESLQSPDICEVDRSEIQKRAAMYYTYINNICKELKSILSREKSPQTIFKFLNTKEFEDVLVEDGDVDYYRDYIGNCLEQGNILKESISLVLKASKN